MSNSNLINITLKADSGNYTQGRSKKIEKITIHHSGCVVSIEELGAIFQRVGRLGSSNYGIGKDGKIGLFVDEKDTPWTDGNWDSNCKSVTIETSNSKTGGNWPVSDEALNSLIKLVADIAKRNNLGKLVKGKNLTWHNMYDAYTLCPGEYLLSKMDYICEKANEIIEGKNEYFIENGEYRLDIAKCLHTTPALGNNLVNASTVDDFTKTILENPTGNAMLKKGTELKVLKITKENGRTWGSYGNCWVELENELGEKQATRI